VPVLAGAPGWFVLVEPLLRQAPVVAEYVEHACEGTPAVVAVVWVLHAATPA